MDRKFKKYQETTIQQRERVTGEEILFEEQDITFFMADYFYNILFKPLCLYMDTLLEQGVYCKSNILLSLTYIIQFDIFSEQ